MAIARAQAMHPALNPELVGEILAVIRALAESGLTMLVVTHEVGFAREVGDGAAVTHAGLILENGAAAEHLTSPAIPVPENSCPACFDHAASLHIRLLEHLID